MTLTVVWLPEAMTAYRSLRIKDPAGAKRVSQAVAMLADEPRPETSSALGGTAFRRLRLDQYRVLYELTRNTVNLFHPGYASRICNTWMALASCPARQGQQRSLRRMRQALSCAFARSPGERSFACALLACFWDSGLFFPLYGIFAYVLP